ncbi:hypothetical protein FBBAL38_08959 [Flavobacteria bacterium BAL38]|nr:hypothetical protein FBBAL38_08959 [Flavobacteria bacterium BAL38]
MFSLNLKLIRQIYIIFLYKITYFVMLLTILLTTKIENVNNQGVKKTKKQKIKVFLIKQKDKIF